MQGYTDRHLRYLFRLLLPDATVWTEMLKPRDLLSASPAKQQKLLQRGREGDGGGSEERGGCVLQLGGDDPDELVRTLLIYRFNSSFNLPLAQLPQIGQAAWLLAV